MPNRFILPPHMVVSGLESKPLSHWELLRGRLIVKMITRRRRLLLFYKYSLMTVFTIFLTAGVVFLILLMAKLLNHGRRLPGGTGYVMGLLLFLLHRIGVGWIDEKINTELYYIVVRRRGQEYRI